MDSYPSTNVLLKEVEAVEVMLRETTFYTTVSLEEKIAIYNTMQREFSSTGHWFTCVNGHPFTIGECGGAMQQSTCPECGAAIGGRDHQMVEGVSRDDGM